MTDITFAVAGGASKRLADRGDGTHAEVVVAAGLAFSAQAIVTRPADTTPYSAGDVVGATAAAIEFADIGPAGGHIVITDADLRIDVSAVPAGMTTLRIHLYNETPPSALADNAPWDLPAGDRAVYQGYIDLGTPVDVGSTLFVQPDPQPTKMVKMGSTSSLFGYLVTVGGYTPSSAAVKSVRLGAVGA